MGQCSVLVGEQTVLEHVNVALRFRARFRGLMLRKALSDGEGLYLPRCNSIHSFFMRFAIDVVYLDARGRIVKIVHGMKPFRLSFSSRARSVLEAQAGWAEEHQLKVGDSLLFESEAQQR